MEDKISKRVLFLPLAYQQFGSEQSYEVINRVYTYLLKNLQADNVICLGLYIESIDPWKLNDGSFRIEKLKNEIPYIKNTWCLYQYFRIFFEKEFLKPNGIDLMLVPLPYYGDPYFADWLIKESYWFNILPRAIFIYGDLFKHERDYYGNNSEIVIHIPSEYDKLKHILADPTKIDWQSESNRSYYLSRKSFRRYNNETLSKEIVIANQTNIPEPYIKPARQGKSMIEYFKNLRITKRKKKPYKEEVYLAVSTPRTVYNGSEFVAKFSAYIDEYKNHVSTVFKQESPRSSSLMDLHTCRWKTGTKVSVRLSSRGLKITNDFRTFTWNGQWEIQRFDVTVPKNYKEDNIILKFDVVVLGLLIATLRPEIQVKKHHIWPDKNVDSIDVSMPSPRSAFASYSKKDRIDVLKRIRSLQIATDINVFLDCLSIRPGEKWKSVILENIKKQDTFWLFWSRNAMKSKWVEWEWRNALIEKSLNKIQPHPLESSESAPAPKELEELQFGSIYELYFTKDERGSAWLQKIIDAFKLFWWRRLQR